MSENYGSREFSDRLLEMADSGEQSILRTWISAFRKWRHGGKIGCAHELNLDYVQGMPEPASSAGSGKAASSMERCGMTIVETAVAGTLESSDIMITLSPRQEDGIEIDLSSSVIKQFGNQIRAEIEKTLADLGVKKAKVVVVDKGAMDCTIRARVRTAATRAAGVKKFAWQKEGAAS